MNLTAEGFPAFAYTPDSDEEHVLKVVKVVNSWYSKNVNGQIARDFFLMSLSFLFSDLSIE